MDHVFNVNDYVSAKVLDIDSTNKRISVSLRTDKAGSDKVINSISDLTRGQVIKGFVKNISNNGVYVSLGRSIYALVRVSDLSDSYLKDWQNFSNQINQLLVKLLIVNKKVEF